MLESTSIVLYKDSIGLLPIFQDSPKCRNEFYLMIYFKIAEYSLNN